MYISTFLRTSDGSRELSRCFLSCWCSPNRPSSSAQQLLPPWFLCKQAELGWKIFSLFVDIKYTQVWNKWTGSRFRRTWTWINSPVSSSNGETLWVWTCNFYVQNCYRVVHCIHNHSVDANWTLLTVKWNVPISPQLLCRDPSNPSLKIQKAGM